MQYKFQREYSQLIEQCPPQDYLNKNIESYRWVFDNIKNEENFRPLAKKNPARVLSMSEKNVCKAHAISMFHTKDAAIKRFAFFRDGLLQDKAYRVLGTKLAKGNITKEHGVNSIIDKKGHFSHHQYDLVDLSVIFKIIDDL